MGMIAGVMAIGGVLFFIWTLAIVATASSSPSAAAVGTAIE
jgi:hypothetical protein